MSENITQSSADPRPEFTFPTESDTVEFVETLRDNYGFCSWCWKPLKPAPIVQFPGDDARPLVTGHWEAVEDYPPHRQDEQGHVTDYTREKATICNDCGVIDIDPSRSRTKQTTWRALCHLCTLLKANDVRLNPLTAQRVLVVAIEVEGRTGQATKVLGEAIYESTPD